jgi:TonB family protein
MGARSFWFIAAIAVIFATLSPAFAQLHGRWHVEFRTTDRDSRRALVGVSHSIEVGLARCAPHTAGQASTTQVTLRFASGHVAGIASAPFESEPPPSAPLRTCIENAVNHATIPAIHEASLVVLVRFAPPAADPDMSVDHAAVAAEYPQESVRRVVHDHTTPITHCFEQTRATHPTAQGVMRVRFTIGVDGHVTDASTETDEPGVPALTTCVLDALRGWVFPVPPSGAPAQVVYPFVFNAPG